MNMAAKMNDGQR